MASHAETAHRWAHGGRPLKSTNVIHDGNTIYSHGHHWALGVNVANRYYFLAEHYGSASTSKHEGHVRNAVPHYGTKIANVPQRILESIKWHFREENSVDCTPSLHSELEKLANKRADNAIRELLNKPYINSGPDYSGLPRRIDKALKQAIDLNNYLIDAAEYTNKPYVCHHHKIIEIYKSKFRDYIANHKTGFLPYGLYLILNTLEDNGWDNIELCLYDWDRIYPGYRERRIELEAQSANRSEAMGGRGTIWWGTRSEEDWQEWYAYKKNFRVNDTDGFTRLRLLKSDRERVQSSLGVSFSLRDMRLALVAYDKGLDKLPSVKSTIGSFGNSSIYRNGTEENSYAIYGCHKVRISEARKLLETSKLSS